MQSRCARWCARSPGIDTIAASTAPQPLTVFTAVEADRARCAALAAASRLASGRRPRSGPTVTSRSTGTCTRCRGVHRPARRGPRATGLSRCSSTADLIKTWARVTKGKQTDWADYPPEKVAFFMRTPTWCRRRAAELGPSCHRDRRTSWTVNALHRLRSAQGVIGFADKYSDRAAQRRVSSGHRGRRPDLSDRQRDPRRRDRDRRPPINPGRPAAPAHLHGPARLFAIDGDGVVEVAS